MKFQPMGKIPRLSRDMIITEKLDGTNASVKLVPEHEFLPGDDTQWVHHDVHSRMLVFAGSPTRWLDTSSKGDNFGFAKWVVENAEELLKLGPGHHFGEWWGQGINRGYNLDHKRFSLFNVHRWGDDAVRPACCHVVPTLYQGPFRDTYIDDAMVKLHCGGSRAAPGFMNPEGIIIYHTAGNYLFKKTIEKDEEPKGKSSPR